MMASRLDITQIFGDLDDFYLQWSRLWRKQKQLPERKPAQSWSAFADRPYEFGDFDTLTP